jgi:hypothetical protein
VTGHAEEHGNEPEHRDDDPDRPYDRDLGEESDYQQDYTEDDHGFPLPLEQNADRGSVPSDGISPIASGIL